MRLLRKSECNKIIYNGIKTKYVQWHGHVRRMDEGRLATTPKVGGFGPWIFSGLKSPEHKSSGRDFKLCISRRVKEPEA